LLGDIDMFAFSAAAGAANFNVTPAARSPNLDALVTLRNAAGILLASVNPVDALDTSFSIVLPAAGTYYLAVQGTGKGDPLTTGYTNYGSVGQYAVSASFATTGNQTPLAVITASSLRGTAPLTVNFSGASSSDPDGSIGAYAWRFGDGGSAPGVTTSHTYSIPGSYSAQLEVTDNGGMTATSSVTVTVDAPVTLPTMSVPAIDMGLTVGKNGNAQATAAVHVLGSNQQPVVGATVGGTWSGLVSGSVSATTDANGVAQFKSSNSRRTGTFTFTVNSATLSGYRYTPGANLETSDSITR